MVLQRVGEIVLWNLPSPERSPNQTHPPHSQAGSPPHNIVLPLCGDRQAGRRGSSGLRTCPETAVAPSIDKLTELEFPTLARLISSSSAGVVEWVGVNKESRCTRLVGC